MYFKYSVIDIDYFDEDNVGTWCTDCLKEQSEEGRLLSNNLAVRADLRRHPAYRHVLYQSRRTNTENLALRLRRKDFEETLRKSPYLQSLNVGNKISKTAKFKE